MCSDIFTQRIAVIASILTIVHGNFPRLRTSRPTFKKLWMSSFTTNKGLVWFRSGDLRLHDNAALTGAHRCCDQVSHVFCFEPNEFSANDVGIPRTSYKRFKFLLQSINDLSRNVERFGGRLDTFIGDPASILPKIVSKSKDINSIFFQKKIASFEVSQERKLIKELRKLNEHFNIHPHFGDSFLVPPNDLPFAVKDLEIFTTYRKAVEKNCVIGDFIPAPTCLKPQYNMEDSIIQSEDLRVARVSNDLKSNPIAFYKALCELGGSSSAIHDADLLQDDIIDPRSVLPFEGGETAALARVNHYITNGANRLSIYKETRNGLINADYSSKLAPWLATGCISTKYIHKKVKEFEADSGIANESTYWLIFELLWRDYMQLYAMKFKNAIFHLGGPQGAAAMRKHPWKKDLNLLRAWIEGRTGYPFIDANMRELRLTGFMSNRGRQNVASFFVRDLGLDWRLGAQYFESQLLDYDVCSNYGNWQYVAGVGSDPREDRYFNIVKQGRDYDPEASFIRLWMPEIARLPTAALLDPRTVTEDMRQRFGISTEVLARPVTPLQFGGPVSGSHSGPVSKGRDRDRRKPTHGNVPGRKQAW